MTRFEQFGRTISCVVFLAAAGVLVSRRKELDRRVFYMLLASLTASCASEFASAVATQFTGTLKVAAHLFEVVSLYLVYRAFVEVGLTKPYDLVFRNLKRSEEASQRQRQFLEAVLDTVQTGIVACDGNGILTLFNRAALRVSRSSARTNPRRPVGETLRPIPSGWKDPDADGGCSLGPGIERRRGSRCRVHDYPER